MHSVNAHQVAAAAAAGAGAGTWCGSAWIGPPATGRLGRLPSVCIKLKRDSETYYATCLLKLHLLGILQKNKAPIFFKIIFIF